MTTEKPTALTQEVRLATTLTGGVSLSIWMAGVSREINLLAQASRWRYVEGLVPDRGGLTESAKASLTLYKRLLELLDIVVEVDVLTGTSAGGINSAFLALSRVKGCDLGRLRDLWLDLGALTELIRNPADKNTPSLLYGDEKLYAELYDQIPTFEDGPFPPPTGPPPRTIAYITTTLLNGETSRFTDSFGTSIQDVDRRGVFTFDENDLASDNAVAALALAARCSASFPLAFEPSFVPFATKTEGAGNVPPRPAMDLYANITRPHWVADGGLLDNQPIDLLLDRIFDSRADRPVRRVLLYIVPSSGPAPNAKAEAGDDPEHPLGLLDALLKDLSAATSQSIAADLRAIREHQDRMEARTDARLRLAELARNIQPRLLNESLLADYRTREATKHADILTEVMMRQLSTWPTDPGGLPKDWRNELGVIGIAESTCRRAIVAKCSESWPSELPNDFSDFDKYGRPAHELALASVIAIIQAAYQLAECTGSTKASKDAMLSLAKFVEHLPFPDRTPTPRSLNALVHGVLVDSVKRGYSLERAASEIAAKYLIDYRLQDGAWEKLATLLRTHVKTLRSLLRDVPSMPAAQRGSLRERQRSAAGQLRTYLNYLHTEKAANVQIARKLFDLAVTQRAMLPADADVEQSLELVQVSADTRSLVAPNFLTADQKLTAMQFHHFGAFYKRSWRANDWMWGRLDGAGWLVHALLDPRRVRLIAQRNGYTRGAGGRQRGARWLIAELKSFGAPTLPIEVDEMPPSADGSTEPLTEARLLDELAFIDDPQVPIPPSIPLTSLWLATVWQHRVLDDELNGLAETVVGPRSGPPSDWSPRTSQIWADKVRHADGDAKYQLLKENPVASETFATDAGSPLMAQTVTKATATALAAARSVRQIPGAIRPLLISLQTLALAGYRIVSLTHGIAKQAIKIGAVLLVLGIAFAIQDATLPGVAGLAAAGLGGYLLVLGTWQSSSKPDRLRASERARRRAQTGAEKPRGSQFWRWVSRPLVPLLSVTVVWAVLALACPVVRKWLFGTDQRNNGVLGRHVYWLGSQWWHPLLAVGVFVLIAILTGAVMGPSRARDPRPPG